MPDPTVPELLRAPLKPKERVARIAEAVLRKGLRAAELMEAFRAAGDNDKGTLADAMKHVSKERPDLLAPFIGELASYVDRPAARVRWGVPEAIGNMAARYPREAAAAVPKLLANARDASTVVRWCAAYALAEVAKHDDERRAEHAALIEGLAREEANSGVRNVYLKALKAIGRGGRGTIGRPERPPGHRAGGAGAATTI